MITKTYQTRFTLYITQNHTARNPKQTPTTSTIATTTYTNAQTQNASVLHTFLSIRRVFAKIDT